jgi:RNA polymerase sigma-70 factor (ECF subfamily)
MDPIPMHQNHVRSKMKGTRYEPGSDKDFGRLYRDTYSRVLATLQSMVPGLAAAEDCAQETFVHAFRAWGSWKPDAPAEVWLHRIAINTAITYRRREWLRQPGELIRRIGYPLTEVDPTNDDSQALLEALRRLPPHLSAVIVLRHVHGYTNREIAAALDTPESTIGYRLATAKNRLATELAAEGIEAKPRNPVATPQLNILINEMSRPTVWSR